jgi:SRSO17 transposase
VTARQYSGTAGGISMCQVLVTLTLASPGRARAHRPVPVPAGGLGRGRRAPRARRGPGRTMTVKKAAGLVQPGMWQRMRTGQAAKGARDYYWAMIGIAPDDTPEGHDAGHAVLPLRRHRYTGTVSYFLCQSPDPVPLARLIKVAVTRWRIEEDHQISKQVAGLDAGRSRPGPPGTAGPPSPR